MKNLLKDFRAELAETLLDLLWGAWSQVGVMGHGQPGEGLIVDPEPLLLLTWECARQDSRIFDEVLDWLVRNGRWVNVVRLTTLLKEDHTCPVTLAGAVAAFMMQRNKGPKWRKLAEHCQPDRKRTLTPLFQREGKPLNPIGDERDEIFARYGWARSPVFLRGQSQPMPVWTPTSLVLKCRALFGVNIRADVFAWLVAHGQGTASGLARELGYSQRRVQDTLLEMQLAELFQIRLDGNRKAYSLDPTKGWELLFEASSKRAAWFNWRAFGRGISIVWKKAFTMKEQDLTADLFESEVGKALVEAQPDLTSAGVPLSTRPSAPELVERLKRIAQMGRERA